MKLEQGLEEEVVELVLNLGQVEPAQAFRFAHVTYEDALREDLFYMPTKTPQKDGRVDIVNISNGEILRRDVSHRCIAHTAKLSVYR